jgi:hypothetical protein
MHWGKEIYSLFSLSEESQIDLEDSLQQAHIRALVETDLMFPHVHNKNLDI